MDTIDRLILGYVNSETCEFASNADPYTGSTSRPPLDPIGRDVQIKGPFCKEAVQHSEEEVAMVEEPQVEEPQVEEPMVEDSGEEPPRRLRTLRK